jgi:hypothetical protein
MLHAKIVIKRTGVACMTVAVLLRKRLQRKFLNNRAWSTGWHAIVVGWRFIVGRRSGFKEDLGLRG